MRTAGANPATPDRIRKGPKERKKEMIQYAVVLKRYENSSRPDVIVYRDEDREKAISEMQKYVKANGFTVHDKDGIFTIKTITLEAKEPIAGSPILSVMPYHELFDHLGNRLK